MPALAFDASPLNHFALAGELATLEVLVRGKRCVVTEAVREEITKGLALHPELAAVERLPWLETVTLSSLEELYTFAEYLRRLGSTQRNAGEASVLAWAEVNSANAFVDDQAAYNVARSRGVTVYRTLNIILRAYRADLFTESRAQELVNALVKAGSRFPSLAQTDLFGWARQEGLL